MNPCSHNDFKIQISPLLRRKGSKRGALTVGEKVSIAHQAIVLKLKYAEIAKAFRVSVSVVSQIVKKVLKNPNALDEISSKRENKNFIKETVVSIVEQMIKERVHIGSAKIV